MAKKTLPSEMIPKKKPMAKRTNKLKQHVIMAFE